MRADGLPDFQDFITEYPKYGKYAKNPVAQQIFNDLEDYHVIQSMINYSDMDKPALAAPIPQLEAKYGGQNVFDLSDDFTKQCLGTMVKVILSPFGYVPVKQKDMPKGQSKFVKSASVYHKKRSERLKLVQKLSVEKAN